MVPRLTDRLLFGLFLQAWAILFFVFVGLYVVIDLFSNVDEFVKDQPTTALFARRVGLYYSLHSLEYFARLSTAITVMAATNVLWRLHRTNEIVPLLAAGVPTRRLTLPVLAGVVLVLGLGVVNRELLLPQYARVLERTHDNIEGKTAAETQSTIDGDRVMIRAEHANHLEQRLTNVRVLLPGDFQEVEFGSATFHPGEEGEAERRGAAGRHWVLRLPRAPGAIRPHPRLEKVADDEYRLYCRATFSDMTRGRLWTMYAGTADLLRELQSEQARNPTELRATIHGRVLQPLASFFLVLGGIPFVLQWGQKNFRAVGSVMLMTASFFVMDTVSSYFAVHGYLEPLTAAWLPVFVYGPLAVALVQRVST